MRRFPALILLVVYLVCITGCSDDTTAPETAPVIITGMVTDADGSPVAGAAILLDLDLEVARKTTTIPPATVIQFNLPEADQVHLDVLSACGADIFASRDLDLSQGSYAIPIESTDDDGRQLTDQLLQVVLTTSDATFEFPVLLLQNAENDDGDYGQWDPAFVSDNVRIQATTDEGGRFTVIDPCVGFGTSFTVQDEEGNPTGETTIAWRVRVWAYHADYTAGAPSGWSDLDPGTGGNVDPIMLGP